LEFWLDRADYYDADNFRGVMIYDSAEELVAQLEAFHETDMERGARQAWITMRRNSIWTAWSVVLRDFLRPL
jgi:hypothetical protein